ncbi:hypothetical protein BT63DRAFT_438002 [Microthyrium microscopicum]|uniref:Exocyst complex component EXO84 n=1 Tax=Microthyrium microscopicum TaxID=703497 RepID=A0A6A6UIV5_9PEZI|nr:hypothetical protein BT63DRAFT_438002 [Microthyrium microscopicum]
MDDKGKSLRQKRTGKLKISNPTLISAPKAANNTIDLKEAASRPSTASTTATTATSATRNRDGLPGSLQAGAGGPAGGLPGGPRARPRNTDQTADLVKRRYSTRFQPQQDLGDAAPPVPSMPSMPKRYAQPLQEETSEGRVITVDPTVLQDGKYDPDRYVTAELRDATAADITLFQRELQRLKQRAGSDIQRNVFQNRTQFIKISKDADKLKTELRTMRNLMSELTGTLAQVSVAGGAPPPVDTFSMSSRNRANRSSVANLEALWTSHLQELWRRVEGSQKYLPAIAGRHVVYESGRWVELNSATWKPRRKVHLILLNDHLLIATEKKRSEATKDPRKKQRDEQPSAPLTAVKCWPLQDVNIADLAMRVTPGTGDPASSSHSVNVRVGAESLTFATASKEINEKISLLSSFRKTSEDLRRKLDSENQDQTRNEESNNGLSSPLFKTTFGDAFASTNKSDFLVDVDGKPQNLRWIEAQMDDLDIDTALQRFEEAVARIETLRRIVHNIRSNTAAQTSLNRKLDERAAHLAGTITRYLADAHSWMSSVEKNVNWLFRLGFEDRAREAYLEARTTVIHKRIRQVIFDGDLHLYIYQVSFIYFTIIKHCAIIFQACFPPTMLSACVKWAKGHVDDFNALLQRQLSSVERGSDTWTACMARAQEHATMLGQVGMDFKDLVGSEAEGG